MLMAISFRMKPTLQGRDTLHGQELTRLYPIIVYLRTYIAEPNRSTFPAMSEKLLCDNQQVSI